MATLTANVPRLPEHCPHKLPTSCRLSALPTCCACQDRRPHSSSYSKYIDGVGFVLRGTRQERYCWMCKEFWNARVQAANIRQSDTRIPDVPDQTGFLKAWFDWHRGFKIINHENGSQEHQTLIGERLEDVPPGHLPRTLDELQTDTSYEYTNERTMVPDPNSTNTNSTLNDSQNLEIDPEDRIFDDVPSSPPMSTTTNGAGGAESQALRVASLRRELYRMRSGIERVMSGLQELGEQLPESEDAVHRSLNLDSRLRRLQSQISRTYSYRNERDNSTPFSTDVSEFAIAPMDTTESSAQNTSQNVRSPPNNTTNQELLTRLNNVAEEENSLHSLVAQAGQNLTNAESQLSTTIQRRRILEREIRLIEQNTRIFGSREDVERQGADYESPIAGMFSTWGARYRSREEERHRQRDEESRQEAILTQVLAAEVRVIEATAEDSDRHHHDDNDEVRDANNALTIEVLERSRSDGWLATVSRQSNPNRTFRALLAEQQQQRLEIEADLGDPMLLDSPSSSSNPQTDDTTPAFRRSAIRVPRRRNRFSAEVEAFVDHSPNSPRSIHRDGRLRDPWRVQREALCDDEWHFSSASNSDSDEEDDEGMPHGSISEDTKGLDKDDGRPEPVDEKDMMVKMECKICYSQLASVALLPCGHCVMCEWCATQHMPSHKADKTIPAKLATCPVCRKRVKQKVMIYRG